MASSFDVVVIGGLNTDYLVRGDTLPEAGETVEGREFLSAAGGKGGNQAVAAARLGARVAFIGKVGRDARGDELIESLESEGIATKFIYRDKRAGTTGVALVMVDARGEKQILTAPGANQRITLKDLARAAHFIRNARVLLMQFEAPTPVIVRAAKMAVSADVKVVLDPAPPRKVPRSLLRCVDFIRPNASEAEAITGIKVSDRSSALRAAAKLMKAGVSAVAIQAGDEGDLIVWRGNSKPLTLPKIKVKSIDATGAGDAFAAACAVGIARGLPYTIIGPFASAAAALATTKFGAQPAMPRLREVLGLMKRAGFGKEAKVVGRSLGV